MLGKYQLLKVLGAGGMAEVYLARASSGQVFEKALVVKSILPHLNTNEDFIKMFLDEARISASLQHANIVQVFDFGSSNGRYYLAMEFVWGRALSTIARRLSKQGGAPPFAIAVAVGIEICKALDYAHRKRDDTGGAMNLVHRDVSPSNILISFEGEVKLLDFGIAAATGKNLTTSAGVLKGKLRFMCPEQASGSRPNPQWDIYSLGVVLYELLTGKPLFEGQTDLETLEKVRNPKVPPLSSRLPNVHPALEAALAKALSADPTRRYLSCHEMQEDLEKVQRALGHVSLSQAVQKLFPTEMKDEEAEHRALFSAARKEDGASYQLKVDCTTQADFQKRYGWVHRPQGFFLKTPSPKPVGTRVVVQFLLSDRTLALQEPGEVLSIKTDNDPGMVVRLESVRAEPFSKPISVPTAISAKEVSVAAPPQSSKTLKIALASGAAVALLAGLAVLVPPALERRQLDKEIGAIERLIHDNPDEAYDRVVTAVARHPESEQLPKLAVRLAERLRQNAEKALADKRFAEAVKPLEKSAQLLPKSEEIAKLLRTAQAGTFAAGAGMVQVDEFWIDQYEYPNTKGATPMTSVDWKQAQELCARAKKRLCTEAEWLKACEGTRQQGFPYGFEFQKTRCNTGTTEVVVSGAKSKCVTEPGVFDLSGNAAEWTSTPLRPGSPQKIIRGGNYSQVGPDVSCHARDYFISDGSKQIGFRCCYSPVGEESGT
ncbi:MAG: protein kinase domain-containing protein [Myxococcota bacterium]